MESQQFRAVLEWIRKGDHFLVVSHVNPDGDATGSLLAMEQILKKLHKQGTLVNEGRTPVRFSFLPGFDKIVDISQNPLNQTFSKVICVDCADYQRIGNVERWISPDAEIINIDHHPTNNCYGLYALVNENASSTCEVIFDFLQEVNIPIDEELAQCLYTGYLTDTGGFRYSNTTPKVLRDASKLVSWGAKPYETAERVLETVTEAHLKLLSRSLSTLELTHGGKVAFLSVPLSILQETGATTEDAEGIVNYGRNIEGVEVAVLLRETEDGVKASLRSKAVVDVSQIAKELGGGGHVRAAGCFLPQDLKSARKMIEPLIERNL